MIVLYTEKNILMRVVFITAAEQTTVVSCVQCSSNKIYFWYRRECLYIKIPEVQNMKFLCHKIKVIARTSKHSVGKFLVIKIPEKGKALIYLHCSL